MLFKGRAISSSLHGLVVVSSYEASFFLNISYNFHFGWWGEVVSSFSQKLCHELSEISSCQLDSRYGMRDWETFVNGNSVSNSITWIAHNTSGSTSRVEREDSLDSNIHARNIEGLKHDGCHLFSVHLGVKRSFGQKNWVLIWLDSQFFIESMVPDFFHVIPVLDDTMSNWIGDL